MSVLGEAVIGFIEELSTGLQFPSEKGSGYHFSGIKLMEKKFTLRGARGTRSREAGCK